MFPYFCLSIISKNMQDSPVLSSVHSLFVFMGYCVRLKSLFCISFCDKSWMQSGKQLLSASLPSHINCCLHASSQSGFSVGVHSDKHGLNDVCRTPCRTSKRYRKKSCGFKMCIRVCHRVLQIRSCMHVFFPYFFYLFDNFTSNIRDDQDLQINNFISSSFCSLNSSVFNDDFVWIFKGFSGRCSRFFSASEGHQQKRRLVCSNGPFYVKD